MSTRSDRARRVAAFAAAALIAACSGSDSGPAAPPDPPRLAGFDPVEARIGDEVRVLGERFGGDPDAFEVRFGQVAAEVVSVGESSAVFRVPEVLPGATQVVVAVDGRTSEAGTFRVLGAPAFRPPEGSVPGRWERTLLRTAADGTCPDPLPERQVVELTIDDFRLSLGEATGDVQLDGTWTATGTVLFDDGSSIVISIEARFTIEGGRLAIVGDLVRDHRAPDGTSTCVETYDLRLARA